MTQTEPNPTDPCPEDPEDALLEGDRTFTPGTAASALRHRTFRTVYFGAFASNIGTWMQNVVLGALAYELSGGSPLFVGLVMFAQLGPLLVLSMVGGMLADAVDRKKLLIALTVEQALFSGLLALVALGGDDASKWALFAVTLAIGIGNALYAPTFSAILPILVPREDMAGAISLNSAQMNGSRVIGPAIGAFLYARYGAVVGVPAQRSQLRGHHPGAGAGPAAETGPEPRPRASTGCSKVCATPGRTRWSVAVS